MRIPLDEWYQWYPRFRRVVVEVWLTPWWWHLHIERCPRWERYVFSSVLYRPLFRIDVGPFMFRAHREVSE